ncbi:MAG TPA: hypothetical protein VM051_11580 [Usitatibacter sp.]|nr:hypothetical protein [Usitatibacter sp.]
MKRAFRGIFAVLLASLAFAASASEMPRFDQLEKQLKIRPEQKEQFDMAVGATKRALLAVALSAMEVKDRLAEELLKPRPDFTRLIDSYDRIVDQHRPLFKEASAEWKKLYAILDDEQVLIAKEFLRDNLGRALAAAIPDTR